LGAGYVHLSMSERVVIESQLRLGYGPAVIAEDLGRSRSTITREMHRNGWRQRSQRVMYAMPVGRFAANCWTACASITRTGVASVAESVLVSRRFQT
jgi:hypothetical protein